MTPDPYPDLQDDDPLGLTLRSGDEALGDVAELSEADSRLLDALSRPAPPVVTAVEDQFDAPYPSVGDQPVPRFDRRGPLTPVFQEPPG